jgi:hypothetical protein
VAPSRVDQQNFEKFCKKFCKKFRPTQGVVSKLFSSDSQITDFCDRGQRARVGSPKLPYRVSGLGPGLAATRDRVVGVPSALSIIRLTLETCLDTTTNPPVDYSPSHPLVLQRYHCPTHAPFASLHFFPADQSRRRS